MPVPGLVPGGDKKLLVPNGSQSMGVFARYPGATPKYAMNKGQRDAEFRETMARMFIQVPKEERKLFLASLPRDSQPLAKVLCGTGEGASGGTGYIDFLLTGVQESFAEKVQVVESLSDNFVVYSFGQAAPTFSFSGTLLNTWQDDQRVWMLRLYRDLIRATQLARRRQLLRLRYDSVIVSGIVPNMSQMLDGMTENAANFSFSMIITQMTIFTPAVGVPTQLQTGFSPGAGFALDTMQPTPTQAMRVVAANRPPLPGEPKTKTDSASENLQVKEAEAKAAALEKSKAVQLATEARLAAEAQTSRKDAVWTGANAQIPEEYTPGISMPLPTSVDPNIRGGFALGNPPPKMPAPAGLGIQAAPGWTPKI